MVSNFAVVVNACVTHINPLQLLTSSSWARSWAQGTAFWGMQPLGAMELWGCLKHSSQLCM